MKCMSRQGWLMTYSAVPMNIDSFSFLVIQFSPLWMISALSHCILWSSFYECSAILDLNISPIFVLHLCCVTWISSGVPISPTYFLQHLHEKLYMQWYTTHLQKWSTNSIQITTNARQDHQETETQYTSKQQNWSSANYA